MAKKYLIIGASAAGISAAAKLRQLDASAHITVVTDETGHPYNKCFLADYLSGLKGLEGLLIKKETFFEDNQITLRLGCKVVALNREQKQVVCADSTTIAYDKLLLAVGGSVVFPPIPGLTEENGVFPFYTLQDTQRILEKAQQSKVQKVVIIGAGLSGIECADSLTDYVESITVIEREAHVLYRQITQEAADIIQTKMKEVGVAFLGLQTVVSVDTQGVTLADGVTHKADMIICAMGARPNGWLAQEAGLAVINGAVVTNEALCTNDPSIFAAGDVALVTDKLSGEKIKSCSWPDALIQGMTAASNMAGIEKKYEGTVTVTSSAFFDMKFFVCGNIKKPDASYNSVLRKNNESFSLTFLKNGVVKAFLLLGKTKDLSELKRSLLTQRPCGLF